MKFTDAIKFAIAITFNEICDTQTVVVTYWFGCFLSSLLNYFNNSQDVIIYRQKGIYQEKIDFDPIIDDEIIVNCYFRHHAEDEQNVWDAIFETEGFSCNLRVKGENVSNYSEGKIRPLVKMLTRYFQTKIYLPSKKCIIED